MDGSRVNTGGVCSRESTTTVGLRSASFPSERSAGYVPSGSEFIALPKRTFQDCPLVVAFSSNNVPGRFHRSSCPVAFQDSCGVGQWCHSYPVSPILRRSIPRQRQCLPLVCKVVQPHSTPSN